MTCPLTMDERLTQNVQEWLNASQAERSLEQGALLLLRLNRNRFMHANILRRQNWDKLTYELQKHLRIRLEGLTAHQVAKMESEAMPRIAKTIATQAPVISTEADQPAAEYHGRRPDHDALPEQVRELYDRNGALFFKMKQLFETLKKMEDATPCDRHELLTQLVEMDREYRANWNTYDTWASVTNGAACDAQGDQEPTADDAAKVTPEQVSAARKFLSIGRKRLAELSEEDAAALKAKMQQRVDLILAAGHGFAPDYRSDLEKLGLVFTERK